MNENKESPPFSAEVFTTTMLLDLSIKVTLLQDFLKEKGILTEEEYQNKYVEVANKISKEFLKIGQAKKDQNDKK